MRPGMKAEDAVAAIDKQITALRDKPVSAQELQKAKNLVQAQFVFGQDSVFNEAMQLGIYQLLGDYRTLDQYLPGIDKVTAADVQRVAKQYLVDSNRTVGVLVPTGILPHEQGGGPAGGAVSHAPIIDPSAEMLPPVASTSSHFRLSIGGVSLGHGVAAAEVE